MHCDQCGKENREGSKFCRYCGSPLSNSSGSKKHAIKISWKNPIMIGVISLLIIVGIFYSGEKAFAYFHIQSKISAAEKLQKNSDYQNSLQMINSLATSSLSSSEEKQIANIESDDKKFLVFQISFNSAVALENASSTATSSISNNLQTALTDLQSIDINYPAYR